MTRLDMVTGNPVWEAKVADPYGPVSAGSSHVVYRDQRGRVSAFSAVDGSVLWSADGPGRLADHLCLSGPGVVGGGWRGYQPLHARDIVDGHVLWSRSSRVAEGPRWAPSAFADGVLTGLNADPVVELVDSATGDTVERWQLPEVVHQHSDAPSPIVQISSDALMIRCGTQQVLALSSSSRVNELWRHPADLADHPARLIDRYLWVMEADQCTIAIIDLQAQRILTKLGSDQQVAAILPANGGVVVAYRSGLIEQRTAAGDFAASIKFKPHLSDARLLRPGSVLVVARSHAYGLALPATAP